MKKYQQLFILALGIVSLILFLIYKHEYDRLRYVIENLEVFGSPPTPHPQIQLPPALLHDQENAVAEHQDLNDEIQRKLGDNSFVQQHHPMPIAKRDDNLLPEFNVIQSPLNSHEKTLNARKS